MSVNSSMRHLTVMVEARIAGIAQELRDDVVVQLSSPGSGRRYGTHQASAPGESPAADQNRLRGSFAAVRYGPAFWRVGTNYDQANGNKAIPVALEFGTRNMAPRPYFRPAVEKLKRRRRR
ncbi:hypothetical protein [Deinococcus peraridilitoris]|uniref:HK97 gp10 family phage protein n=1 Tax=Deinococcus peraridilitoris (strain DSM 19664 / LMG 22246 / CIP 109416 / KR-200) TaxID=937777 RepID=K9ZWP4_DEIPD|nr:hypothetical protein [Deinococcus peraridilitoris]AFZ66068.1 hypothetical protein Deipe_0472 [Deinococcus peraridilitoris DSM 19664]